MVEFEIVGVALVELKPFGPLHKYVPPPVAVSDIVWPGQYGPPLLADAVGGPLITTVVVTFEARQAPDAGIVYVTIYDAGVLKLGLIAPVEEFIDNPEVEEYVPPV